MKHIVTKRKQTLVKRRLACTKKISTVPIRKGSNPYKQRVRVDADDKIFDKAKPERNKLIKDSPRIILKMMIQLSLK